MGILSEPDPDSWHERRHEVCGLPVEVVTRVAFEWVRYPPLALLRGVRSSRGVSGLTATTLLGCLPTGPVFDTLAAGVFECQERMYGDDIDTSE